MTSETITKLYKKACRLYSTDFAAWFTIKILESGQQKTTLKNMYCDYMREKFGRSGQKKFLLDCESKAVTSTTSEHLLLDAELDALLSFSYCLRALYAGETNRSLAASLGVSEDGLYWQLRRDRAKFIKRHSKEIKELCEV